MKSSWSDSLSLGYHLKQWENPKESTKEFINDLYDFIQPDSYVFDVACGAGAATFEISKHFPKTNFLGIDNDKNLVDLARDSIKGYSQKNIAFDVGDFYKLPKVKVDGVISLQTLSWLPDFKKPMAQIFQKLRPEWVGLTSLFYEGEISAKTIITEHKRQRSVYYNTYSLNQFSNFCGANGYKVARAKNFELPFDIQENKNRDLMGTYTRRVVNSKRRLQFSGPLLLNWMTIWLVRH